MKIQIIQIGKTQKSFLTAGEEEYFKRLSKYARVERIELSDLKNAGKLSIEQQKKEEGKAILDKIEPGGWIILLDEKGKEYSSEKFADKLQHLFHLSYKHITFVIGGAFGFSEEVYSMANEKMALSQMTFSHQMVRMIFLEQVYRAFTIIKNEPYHHS